MEWVLRSPQIHSTFSNLGFTRDDGYHINENCNAALETILHNILTEDKYLRTFRRSISFGQNINKDLIPLLLHAKEDKTIELLIRILVNLSIPIECLLSIGVISRTDFGRQTVFEINNLLSSTKAAFTDHRATKVFVEFLKKNVDGELKGKLSEVQCTNISNSLLLLRNILHIPEEPSSSGPCYRAPTHTVQNQILWNIFSQSIDKTLIKLMSVSEATNWSVTMVQLIALLYKDQHVVTLQKLLNLWLEASLSESSEDNESNTSPPDRGSGDSSPMLTSSDSSDTGGCGKSNDGPNSANNGWDADASSVNNTSENDNKSFQAPAPPVADNSSGTAHKPEPMDTTSGPPVETENDNKQDHSHKTQTEDVSTQKQDKKTVISENSDCGYGTQIENQESISTSSNEDEILTKKPVHPKPHNPKQRVNTNKAISLQERKRKKILKRGKCNIINKKGFANKTPTDEDVSGVLGEFTVEFLLKGYNSLVQTLHSQILTNLQLEIDTSHFFWLVTYFLKFATQIELDLQNVGCVLSYDIISYLTAEGVNLCEKFELAVKLDGNDLKPIKRRLHLVVTAIREFVQAIEVYKKFPHIANDDKEALATLKFKMCEMEELRSLFVLLLRNYNPKYHTKQYLQDLVVTNHILLIFLDNVMQLPDYSGSTNMTDHIRQFATPEIMYQYGLLLEDYATNGEFVNDCVFTMMHHVGGELGCLKTLFQPNILKNLSAIWTSEYEICDDWSDLIEYVINTFLAKPKANVRLENGELVVGKVLPKSLISLWLQEETEAQPETESGKRNLDGEKFVEDKTLPESLVTLMLQGETKIQPESGNGKRKHSEVNENTNDNNSSKDRWTEEELSSLSWNYMQVNDSQDMVNEIIKLFKEDGIIKSRESVIRELFKQKLINKEEFDALSNKKSEKNAKNVQAAKEEKDDDINKLCEQLSQDGKAKSLDWVQKVLLDTCFVQICLDKKSKQDCEDIKEKKRVKVLNFKFFQTIDEVPVMSPVAYHSILHRESIPLVPWNVEQAAICKDLKFLQLLHKLGFHMPVDSGKLFIQIPHFWTADILYDIASKIGPIDTSKLKFSINDIKIISESNPAKSSDQGNYILSPPPTLVKDIALPPPEAFYQINKRKHIALVNYTPMPGSSYQPDDGDEAHKPNWLELVQKAQEVKLSLTITRSPLAMTVSQTTEVRTESLSCALPVADPAELAQLGEPFADITKLDEPFAEHLPEPEFYNHSLCETASVASVASDLTRMYVSDEDEKPDLMVQALRPCLSPCPPCSACDPCSSCEPCAPCTPCLISEHQDDDIELDLHDDHDEAASVDSDDVIAEKRQRVH